MIVMTRISLPSLVGMPVIAGTFIAYLSLASAHKPFFFLAALHGVCMLLAYTQKSDLAAAASVFIASGSIGALAPFFATSPTGSAVFLIASGIFVLVCTILAHAPSDDEGALATSEEKEVSSFLGITSMGVLSLILIVWFI